MAAMYQSATVAQQSAVYPGQTIPALDNGVLHRLLKAEEELRKVEEARQKKLAAQARWREKNPDYMDEWRRKKLEQQTPKIEIITETTEASKEQPQTVVEIKPQEILTEVRPHQIVMSAPRGATIISAPLNSGTYTTLLGTPTPVAYYLDPQKAYHMLYNPTADSYLPFNQAASMYTMATINIRGTVLISKEKGDITMDEFRTLSRKLSSDYAQRQIDLARQVDEAVQSSLLSSISQ